MIAGTRLRKGATNSTRGAARLITDALVTARGAGATGIVTVRADSAYYNHDVAAAAHLPIAPAAPKPDVPAETLSRAQA